MKEFKHLPGLDLIRVFGILVVVFYHYQVETAVMSSRFSSRYGAAGPSGGIHHDSPFWILLVLAGKKPQLVHEALSLGTFSGHLPSFLALLFSHFFLQRYYMWQQ